jgi:hypothetical protein
MRLLPCLDLLEWFPPHLYKSWGNSAGSHLHSCAIALGSFSHTRSPTFLFPYACDSFTYFKRGDVARCSSLDETKREIAATALVEVTPTGGSGEVPVMFCDEGRVSSRGESRNSVDKGASNNEISRTNCFGASTITLGHVKKMAEKGYFMDGEA